MKSNKRKIVIVSLVLIGVLLMSMGTVWADQSGNEIQPYSVSAYDGNFFRVSATKATAEVACKVTGLSAVITSKITLQSAPLNTSTFKDVSNVSPNVYKVYNTKNIYHLCSFPITSDKEYRIRIEITDEVSGIPKTTTYYERLK